MATSAAVWRWNEVFHTWRIFYYTDDGLFDIVEVVRKCRPTRMAKALMCEEFTHFEIEQLD
jgi:hypothetical protein